MRQALLARTCVRDRISVTNMCSRKGVPLMPSKRRNMFKPLSILEFQRRFATGEDYARFLFEKRWPKGWTKGRTCPRCGGVKYYSIQDRGLYECAGCRYQGTAADQMSLNIAAGLHLGGNESYPGVFQPFGGFADGIAVEDGYVRLPDVPGVGFETKAELIALMRSLSD